MSHADRTGLSLAEFYTANPPGGHRRRVLETVALDGPQNIIMPATLTQWQSVGNGITVPDYYDRMQMTSGPSVDEVQGSSATATGTIDYQQTVTDWTLKYVKTTEVSTEGLWCAAGARWNTNVQSVFGIIHYKHIAAGGLRVLAMLAGPNCYVSINGSGVIELRNSTGTATGSINYATDGLVHPICVEFILGAGVLGHSGAGVFRLSTDKEQISRAWEITGDGVKGYGGCGAFTPPEGFYGPGMWWVGTKAEALSALTPKVVLQRFGWAVTGY